MRIYNIESEGTPGGVVLTLDVELDDGRVLTYSTLPARQRREALAADFVSLSPDGHREDLDSFTLESGLVIHGVDCAPLARKVEAIAAGGICARHADEYTI